MTRAIMHGCNGKMGQVITGLCKEDPDIEIVAGIDVSNHIKNEYPVYQSLWDCKEEADVIIDFASAQAADVLIDYSVQKEIQVVICTTGLSEEQIERIEAAAQKTAVLRSANMSMGINILMDLLKKAAKVLAPAGFDMEIVEKHHNQKVDAPSGTALALADAPSGTALALADAMNNALEENYEYKYDRSQERKKREKYEIGIQAVRGGNIVGEHEVIFAGTDEVIEFKHTAYSKAIFGKGAIEAAKFLTGKPAGFYDMSDVIQSADR